APNGSALTAFVGSTDQVNLAQSGTYSIMIRDSGDNATGTYALSFFRAPATQPVDPDSGPIPSGQRLTGSIDVADPDVYTFQANTGDAISALVDATAGAANPVIRIFGPTGAALTALVGSADLVNLAVSGTYTIMVRDSGNNA